MATPDFVKFSRIPHSARHAVSVLRKAVFPSRRMRITDFGELEYSGGTLTGGLTLVGDLQACDSEDVAFNRANGLAAFSLTYVVPEIPAEVYFTFFEPDETSCGMTISLDSSIPYFQPQSYEPGDWLVKFLIELTHALSADVCGYGADDAYSVRYESLEPEKVIERLRAGELFRITPPVFHAFSLRLVSAKEMVEIRQRQPLPKALQYKLTTGGYHVLHYLP